MKTIDVFEDMTAQELVAIEGGSVSFGEASGAVAICGLGMAAMAASVGYGGLAGAALYLAFPH